MTSVVLPAYRIETDRLTIRPWSPADAPLVKKAQDESRPNLRQWMTWADREPPELDEVVARMRSLRAAFDRGEDFTMGVFSHDGEVLGSTGLHPRVGDGGIEIGYWVHAARQRQGIATEIAGALTRVAFEVAKVRWVEIRVATSNVVSAKVPPKLGFTLEATLRERIAMPGGRFEDARVFSLFAADYPSSAAKLQRAQAYDALGRALMEDALVCAR